MSDKPNDEDQKEQIMPPAHELIKGDGFWPHCTCGWMETTAWPTPAPGTLLAIKKHILIAKAESMIKKRGAFGDALADVRAEERRRIIKTIRSAARKAGSTSEENILEDMAVALETEPGQS